MGILLAALLALFLVSPQYCLAKGRNSANALNNRGIDLWNAHKYDAAIQQFDQAIKINPRFAEAYSNRGAAYDGLNHPESSVQDYTKALSLNPRLTQAYQFRALSYYDLGRFDEAIKDWNVVLKRRPRDAFAYSKRAVCYQYSGNLQSALQDFEKAVSLDHNLSSAVKGREMVRRALSVTATGAPPTAVSKPAMPSGASTKPVVAGSVVPPAMVAGKPPIVQTKTPLAHTDPASSPVSPVAVQPTKPTAVSPAQDTAGDIVISSSPEPAPAKGLSVESEPKPAPGDGGDIVISSAPVTSQPKPAEPNSQIAAVPPSQTLPATGASNPARSENSPPSSLMNQPVPRAVPLSPVSSAANVVHHLVGNLLYFFHQFDGAYASYSQAAIDNPGDQFAYFRAGNALRASGQKTQALASYEQALRVKPNFRQAIARRDELVKELGPAKQEPTP